MTINLPIPKKQYEGNSETEELRQQMRVRQRRDKVHENKGKARDLKLIALEAHVKKLTVYLAIKNLISSTSAETWQKDRLGKRMETRLLAKLRPARTCASVFSFRLLADLVEVAARSFRERRLLDELLYVAQKTGSMMSRSTLECTRCGNSLGVCSETIGVPFVQVQKK